MRSCSWVIVLALSMWPSFMWLVDSAPLAWHGALQFVKDATVSGIARLQQSACCVCGQMHPFHIINIADLISVGLER